MRHLSATFSVREVARDQYVHSKYSRELVANPAVDAFKYMYVASFVFFCLLPGQHSETLTHHHITSQKLTSPQLRRLQLRLDRHPSLARPEIVAESVRRPRHALRHNLEHTQHHPLRIPVAKPCPRRPFRLYDGHASGRQNHVGGRGRLPCPRASWKC